MKRKMWYKHENEHTIVYYTMSDVINYNVLYTEYVYMYFDSWSY